MSGFQFLNYFLNYDRLYKHGIVGEDRHLTFCEILQINYFRQLTCHFNRHLSKEKKIFSFLAAMREVKNRILDAL